MLLSWRSVGGYQDTQLTRNSSRSTEPRSSQLAEPLWTDPGGKIGINVHELISTLKKKKAQSGNEWSNILPKSSQARKKPLPPLYTDALQTLMSLGGTAVVASVALNA